MKTMSSALLLLLVGAAGESAPAVSATVAVANTSSGEVISLPVVQAENPVLLDGSGNDPVWNRALTLPPLALPSGNAPSVASQVQVVRCGRWLLFGFEAVEPGVLVARETQVGVSLWTEDAFSVDLQAGATKFRFAVNPIGALEFTRNGKYDPAPVAAGQILRTARVTPGAWRAELAVDVGVILGNESTPVAFHVARQRQPRRLYAEEVASFPRRSMSMSLLDIGAGWREAPVVRIDEAPLQHFAGRAILDAVQTGTPPANAAEWAQIPATALVAGDGRRPVISGFEPSEVRAVLTPAALVLRMFCTEHRMHTMSVATDPANIWNTDNIEVCCGPEGYEGLLIEANPGGLLHCASQQLARKIAKTVETPPGVGVAIEKTVDGWSATLIVPIAPILTCAGAPATCRPENHPWTVQVTRYRPARPALAQTEQASVLAVTKSESMRCPSRHALLRPMVQLARTAATPVIDVDLPPPVLDMARRQALGSFTLLERWLGERKAEAHATAQQTLSEIKDAAGWKKFAAERRTLLLKSIFPDGKLPARTALHPVTAYERTGDGFTVEGIIIESRPGYPMPLTVYRPTTVPTNAHLPVLILIPAWHTPRNAPDLQYVGMNLARAGGMAVLLESMGSGERSLTALWEHKCYQRNMAGAQLLLAGEYISAWTAWDVLRCVDYLQERGIADPARVGIMGAVAGGGAESALAALVDERLTLSIPFNFSSTEPQGAYFDPVLCFPNAHTIGYSDWLTDALIAPRQLVQAQEFTWTDAAKESYAQFQKVYGLFDAKDKLDLLHGGEGTHATHFNWMHRIPCYRILNRWWKLALPESRDAEYTQIMPTSQLDCFNAAVDRGLIDANAAHFRDVHAIAADAAKARREAARARRNGRPEALRRDLDALLGNTRPEAPIPAVRPLGVWRGNPVEGVWMNTEKPRATDAPVPGVALWVITPKGAKPGKRAVALGLAHAGKGQFLLDRASEIERLLQHGVSMALLDVRCTGETSPGDAQFPSSTKANLAGELWMFGESLTAGQVKDARTALRYLAGRPDMNPEDMALWGEALAEPNGSPDKPLLFDETGFRQCSPQPKNYVEPMGGAVALFAALYPIETADGKQVRPRGVLVRGGLASFASVLDRRYHYLPDDAVIPGLLSVADMEDIVSSLSAENVMVVAEDFRDGSNRRVAGNPWPLASAPAGISTADAFLRMLTR